MNGGASTTIYRSGTPTLGLAAALQAALALALDEQPQRCEMCIRDRPCSVCRFYTGQANIRCLNWNKPHMQESVVHWLSLIHI